MALDGVRVVAARLWHAAWIDLGHLDRMAGFGAQPVHAAAGHSEADPGTAAADIQLILEAVLWRVRTGPPWRDLPERFGNWSSEFKRFRRWALSGVVERIFNVLSDESDFDCVFADGTMASAHRPAAGARGRPAARGGPVSKIIAVGYLVQFLVFPGQSQDLFELGQLLEGLESGR